jgi:hypothetical protein
MITQVGVVYTLSWQARDAETHRREQACPILTGGGKMRKELAEAMKKRMRMLMYVMAILVMPGLCMAADNVVISEVLYDPLVTETGGEAVELYNPTGSAVDISGYVIKTESSAADATVPAGTVLEAGAYYLIADTGWSSSKDDASWPEADHEEAITMSNTDAGVALAMPDGTIVDAVGWGSAAGIGSGLYEGTPADPVSPGSSLLRTDPSVDTGDNSIDFTEAVPVFASSGTGSGESQPGEDTNVTNQSEAIDISVDVLNNAPVVTYVELSADDDPSAEGTQIMPVPEGNRQVLIDVQVTDTDGIAGIQSVIALVQGPDRAWDVDLSLEEMLSNTTAVYNGSIDLAYHYSAGDYNVSVTANDSSMSGSVATGFEYMSMTAISIDATALHFTGARLGQTADLLGDFALSTLDAPTVRNVGNTHIDLGLYGTDLTSGQESIAISNIRYSLDNDFSSSVSGVLGSSMQIQGLGLANGEDSVTSLGFQIYIPTETPNGNYTGQISVVALSS